MASDTVPAAVPSPGNPSRDTADAPAPGGFASLFAPVAPARTEPLGFDLNPGHDDTTDTVLAEASSADFGDTTSDSGKETSEKDTARQQGIIRAWLLAGAERWRKGADTRNKRLDVQKARAQAFKEARTVTVNRAEKMSGGSTGTNTQPKSGKSNSGSGSGSRPRSGGQNNSTGPGRHGSSGHDTDNKGKGRGHGGGSGKDTSGAGSSGSNSAGTRDKHDSGKGLTKKANSDSHSSNGSGGGGKGRKTATQTCGDDSGISLAKDKKQKARKDPAGTGSTGPQGAAGKSGKDTLTAKTSGPGAGGAADSPQKNPGSKGGGKSVPETKKPGTADLRKDDKSAPKATDPSGKGAKDPKPATGTGKIPAQTPGKGGWKGPALDVRSSRETGYRDGSRLGRVEAHVGAYRDGVRDGRTDIKQAAAREKARLDKAHTDHKPPISPLAAQKQAVVIPPKPTTAPKQTPIPATPVQAAPDMQKKERPVPPSTTRPQPQPAPAAVTPIPVTGIDRTKLTLGPGATRSTISRGEVRTLRHFQKILEEQAAEAGKRAEQMRALEQHAIEQAKAVIQLAEQAKAVEGGDRLLGTLARAEESANGQAAKAAQIHRDAVRAHDHAQALVSNVETRYGDMYKAIINSPETTPADLSYYKDMADA